MSYPHLPPSQEEFTLFFPVSASQETHSDSPPSFQGISSCVKGFFFNMRIFLYPIMFFPQAWCPSLRQFLFFPFVLFLFLFIGVLIFFFFGLWQGSLPPTLFFFVHIVVPRFFLSPEVQSSFFLCLILARVNPPDSPFLQPKKILFRFSLLRL